MVVTLVAVSSAGLARAAETVYVINLASSPKKISASKYASLVKQTGSMLYSYTVKGKTKYKYRVRLGFYKSRKRALADIKQLKKNKAYAGVWLDKMLPGEEKMMKRWESRQAKKKAISRAGAKTLSSREDKKLKALMEKARNQMLEKDYRGAVRTYTKVTQYGNTRYQRSAQEFLGLARERNGQLAHAKAEYKIYLDKFPGDEDARRVEQRLAALQSAFLKPLKGPGKFRDLPGANSWDFNGLLFQYYDRDQIEADDIGKITANEIFSTHFSHGGRATYNRYKLKTDVAVSHLYDLTVDEVERQRLNSLYFNLITPDQKLETRLGRQKGKSAGVVGRFDGVDIAYRFFPQYRFKAIAGFPFETVKTVDSRSDKKFTAYAMEFGPFLGYWDFNIFALRQTVEDIVDRDEWGTEVRYRSPTESFFTLVDYSKSFGTVNYAMTVYNRRFKNKASLDFIADYRKTPFLTSTSALQGQVGASTLNDLIDSFSEEDREAEIERLSLDRTALYKSMTLLYSHPLTKRMTLNTDLGVSNLSGTEASGGVPATEGTGNEYTTSIGVVANGMFMRSDLYQARLRVSDLFNSTAVVANLSASYRFAKKWRINPRFRYDIRHLDNGRDVTKTRPSLRMQYRQNRIWELDFQIDIENKTTSTPGLAGADEKAYLLHIGYLYSFD